MKKQTFNFVLTPGVKKALEIAAEKDRRSMSSLVEKIIVDYLDREGIAWRNEGEKKPVKPKKANQTAAKK
jgi:predicted transcriptional regulator